MTYRIIDPVAGDELRKRFKAHAYAARFDFVSGAVGLIEGPIAISYDGVDFVAAYDIGSISSVTENVDIATHRMSFSLSGLESQYRSLLDDESEYFWRRATLYRVLFNPTTYAQVGDPAIVWRGLMERGSSSKADGRATLTIHATNRLADAQRAGDWRYTGASQRAAYPNDGLYDHVVELADQELDWGGTPVAGGVIAGGSDRPVEAQP